MNNFEILETIRMIEDEHLDIRTITMGISLLDCADSNMKKSLEKIYDKVTRAANKLVKVGEDIEKEYCIPIINKRNSVTQITLIAAATDGDSYVPFAEK